MPPASGPAALPREGAVRAFPGLPGPAPVAEGPLARRIVQALASARRGAAGPLPHVIASELVAALVVDLPRAPARSRMALLAFAVEERVGAPIDAVAVVLARLADPAAGPNAVLAIVVSHAALAGAPPGARVLPDFLALRRPEGPGGPVWAVWRDGARAVVRRSDGTGFAVATEALPALWARAGRPALLSLGAALPSGLPATDLSGAPPPPDPLDLDLDLQGGAGTEAGATRRTLAAAAAIVLAALALHLALAAADAVALGRISAAERTLAEAALAPVLPGVALGPDPTPILARLAPSVPEERRSDFLPLLAEASAAVTASGRAVGLRRLAWGAEDGALSLLVQGPALDDLQAVEQAFRDAGLAVTSGAASAGDGGAEVEMRLGRAAG